ncbi:hypothetical protein V8C35DRAFT_298216 [Trichoderma chlorosporum]
MLFLLLFYFITGSISVGISQYTLKHVQRTESLEVPIIQLRCARQLLNQGSKGGAEEEKNIQGSINGYYSQVQ